MAKRTKSELEIIKHFVDNTYTRFGNRLVVSTDKKFDPEHSELGYCFKFTDPSTGNIVYKIVCSDIGLPDIGYLIMMHEYGHIYLGHLDGIHEDLDSQACQAFQNNRGEIIDYINRECGIDFADKLIERVIDDPALNHSLHNIAMDMEVNSSILSKEDIEDMEMGISSLFPKTEEELLKHLIEHSDGADKENYQKALDKMQKEAKIKLILPCRYHMKNDAGEEVPFPDGLTYTEYWMLLLTHMDQFVKMMVSIQMGGNGDTSGITQQQIQQALQQHLQGKSDAYKKGWQDAMRDYQNAQSGSNNQGQQQQDSGQTQDQDQQQGQGGSQSQQQGQQMNGGGSGGSQDQNQQGQGQGSQGQGNNGQGQNQSGSGDQESQDQADYNQGYQDAMNSMQNGMGGSGMQSLSDMMDQMGMSGDGGKPKTDSPWQGTRDGNDQDAGIDHRTESRQEADKKRELGQIHNQGGIGCGNSGGPDGLRDVARNLDVVDMALDEVFKNVKKRVIKMDTKKDNMKLYNRGVIRSVIAPSITRKITITTDPKIVYLIDISGSMDTRLIDRILKTIGYKMKNLSRGLKYDIITWSTCLGEHIKDIDPSKGVPKISCGGGTSIAKGIQYFKDNYTKEATLVVISDFEDYLEEWHKVESTMNGYSLYGFNYGCSNYYDSDKIHWSNMKIRKFHNY